MFLQSSAKADIYLTITFYAIFNAFSSALRKIMQKQIKNTVP